VRFLPAVFALALALAVASPARADLQVAGPAAPAPVAVSPPSSAPVKEWYGWQFLVGFAVGDALLAAGGALQATTPGNGGVPLLVLGLAARLAPPPILHLLHKRSNAVAAGSAALEIGTPLLGVAIARVAGPSCYEDKSPACEKRLLTALLAGGVAGAIVGSALDVAVLAYGEPWPKRRSRTTFSMVPIPVPLNRGVGVGVAGVF
jgi:hypothetical protein